MVDSLLIWPFLNIFPPKKTVHGLIQTIQADPGTILSQNWVTIQERPKTCDRQAPDWSGFYHSGYEQYFPLTEHINFLLRIKYFGKNFHLRKATLNF